MQDCNEFDVVVARAVPEYIDIGPFISSTADWFKLYLWRSAEPRPPKSQKTDTDLLWIGIQPI
jgi:hypothetical protein